MYPGALIRRIRLLSMPWVRARIGASFDYSEHLNNNGILIVSGNLKNQIHKDALRFLCNMHILMILQHVRGGPRNNTFLLCDELTKTGYLSEHYTAAHAELAKAGLSITSLVQNPAKMHLNEQIQSDLLGNTFKAWGRMQADGAELAAKNVGTAILNPDLIKYVEESWQNVMYPSDESYETVSVNDEGKKTVTRGKRRVNDTVREKVERDVRYTFDEQVRLVAQKIVTLDKGYFYFEGPEGVTVQPMYIPMVTMPFAKLPLLAEGMYDKACRQIFSNSAYRKPVKVEAVWEGPMTESESEEKPIIRTRHNTPWTEARKKSSK